MAARLPHALVLIIDQAEELFTMARTPDEISDRDHALKMLQRLVDIKADVKLIVSLRTEYYRPPARSPAGRPPRFLGREGRPAARFLRGGVDRGDRAPDLGIADRAGAALAPREVRFPVRRGGRRPDRRRWPRLEDRAPGQRPAADPGHLHPALRAEAVTSRTRTG